MSTQSTNGTEEYVSWLYSEDVMGIALLEGGCTGEHEYITSSAAVLVKDSYSYE